MASYLYEIKDLKQRYDKGPLNLDILELKIKSSGVTGLIGPNGSGKSTLLKVLSFLIPYSGSIIFDGEPASGRENEIRRSVTYLLQTPYLLNRSVYENIAYGLKLRGEKKDIARRVNESLEQVGLAPDKFARRPWFRLSGGEAQRVALASRLALRPRVLLLDEPTASVDEASAQLVMEAARSAVKNFGSSVVIATHDINWLYESSGDIVNLYMGKVVSGGADNLFSGGWRLDGGYMMRELGGGPAIFAYPPAAGAPSAAMLNAADVAISSECPQQADCANIIRGRVLQMTYERASDAVLLTAAAGEAIIRARLTPTAAEAMSLVPSAEVYLTFPYAALRWV
ncbi:MAG: ATP-binding cassette domain-containing protein [Cloacibacillus sp.]